MFNMEKGHELFIEFYKWCTYINTVIVQLAHRDNDQPAPVSLSGVSRDIPMSIISQHIPIGRQLSSHSIPMISK